MKNDMRRARKMHRASPHFRPAVYGKDGKVLATAYHVVPLRGYIREHRALFTFSAINIIPPPVGKLADILYS